jgi:hypothetical protein
MRPQGPRQPDDNTGKVASHIHLSFTAKDAIQWQETGAADGRETEILTKPIMNLISYALNIRLGQICIHISNDRQTGKNAQETGHNPEMTPRIVIVRGQWLVARHRIKIKTTEPSFLFSPAPFGAIVS